MDYLLYFSAALLLSVSIAHSYLGERFILARLFKLDNLPHLFGSVDLTVRTLRFAWHLTSIAWLGFAAILISVVTSSNLASVISQIIGATFLIHFVIVFIGSKGKHLSWPIFLTIGIASIFAANT